MKNIEIKALSNEQILDKINEEKKNIQRFNFKKAVSSLESPSVIRTTRRTIARLFTEINQRTK